MTNADQKQITRATQHGRGALLRTLALIRKHLEYAPDCETMVYGGTKDGYVFCFSTSTITGAA